MHARPVWLLGLGFFCLSLTAPAASAGKIRGTLKIFKNDSPYGTDSYTLLIHKDKSVLGSSTTKRGRKKVLYAGFVTLKPNYQLQKFRIRKGGKVLRTSFLFRYKKTYRILKTTGEKKEITDVTVAPDAIVLEPELFFPYVILARRYDFTKKGEQTFPAFVVSTQTGGTVRVTYHAVDGDGPAKHQLKVAAPGFSATVTLGARKRLLKVETGTTRAVHPSMLKPSEKK